MSNQKTLKLRIKSIGSTQKITKAMKMIAATRLKKCKNKLDLSLPYALKMAELISNLCRHCEHEDEPPALLVGRPEGGDNKHIILVVTADKGLCGGFNSSVVKIVKKKVSELRSAGKDVSIFCYGKKGYEQLKGIYGGLITDKMDGVGREGARYKDAEIVSGKLLSAFENHLFDSCTIVYNKFKSAICQEVTSHQLIPFSMQKIVSDVKLHRVVYEYEPTQERVLSELLPKSITIQIYHAMLESAVGEQGARMAAMDGATNNASAMIKSLTLEYNRSRQAAITKELTEIISGAEAV